MRLLVDNDIVLKLASFNLWDEALACLEAAPEDVRWLPTARFALDLHRGEAAARRWGATIAWRLAGIAATLRVLEEAPNDAVVAGLINVVGIDVGERLLFATAAASDSTVVATGDKQSLLALANDPRCAAVHERLRGRLICLEQIVLQILAHNAFADVRARVLQSRALEIDRAVGIAFGAGEQADEREVRKALLGYVTELRSKGVELYTFP